MRSGGSNSSGKASIRHRRYGFDQREPHEDTQRWLVSYADFITLLFAFFVVMYSISQVNEGKYKVISDALIDVFREKSPDAKLPEKTPDQSDAGTPSEPGIIEGTSTSENVVDIDAPAAATQEAISLPSDTPPSEAEKRQFAQTYAQLNQTLKALIDSGQVEIRGSEDWIEVDIRSGLLFDSGSDVLNTGASPVLRDIAAELQKNSYLLRIRGYTDDQPIETERFPSNWELSSSRAVSVVRMLQRNGLEPRRMAVEGFAQFAPITANTDDTARARNRRVVIAISRFHQLPERARVPTGATPSAEPGGTQPAPSGSTPSEPSPPGPSATGQGLGPRGNTPPVSVQRLPDGGIEIGTVPGA